jgi:hypothetical protein
MIFILLQASNFSPENQQIPFIISNQFMTCGQILQEVWEDYEKA